MVFCLFFSNLRGRFANLYRLGAVLVALLRWLVGWWQHLHRLMLTVLEQCVYFLSECVKNMQLCKQRKMRTSVWLRSSAEQIFLLLQGDLAKG
ncbi:hypothetical protein AT237_02435 [Bartonella henselae]|nr:hypothetical protein AT237_02435 [Bartonella henselae]OLL40351.1 hypothetical protein AT244_06580 [Bartonella henselae]OLL43523.1 hypothetical protein AT245_01930 [Bartonella henselae]OLL52632.1 hypothetical protein AT238_01045 [Bartonella henselae]